MMRCATLPKSFVAEIAKEYHPKDVESAWYDWWESSGLFRPISDSNDVNCSKQSKFVVVLPPPNVTGFLHLGHALTGSVQDCLIRWHRMKGHNALYIPGSDHAGIATQVVVEKKLKAESQLSRHDLGRERFIEKVWEWKVKHGGVIQRQLRCLGLSLDWSREMFTMDTDSSLSVTEAFVRLYDDGILYRAKALINWCCTLKSAISDLEVEYIDVTPGLFIRIPNYEKTVEVGTITAFAYKVAGSDEEVIVETTRPETILGDVAVAVHPADARYAHLQGARLKCPFREDTIPLIFDEVLVDMNFGTGAVKVTPAHDPNDFECGKRQGLISVTIFDTEGRITTPGFFCGMHRYDCRRSIIKALDELQLLRGQRGHAMRLGICSRTGDIVEPFLMDQWFVNCSKMAVEAIEKVKTRELVLIPSAHEKTWYHWLEHIRPWCVSRQLWWGHRIPAYQCFLDTVRLGETDAEAWVVGRTEDEARSRAITKFALNEEEGNRLELRRDEDVLDTWFSSALWPLTLLGWPNSTQDLKTFFPTNLLETGHDILFFWVARMVMMSLHLTGQLPFTEVYMHAMVRDKNGEKMSKSKGNVIDPLDVLSGISLPDLQKKLEESNLEQKEVIKAKELQKKTFPGGIPECGADALRFGLLTYTVSGKNVNLDIDRIVGYRQFCNKLWNVVRYALYHSLGPDYVPSPMNLNQVSLPLECHWIRSRLDECAEICNHSFSKGNYDFSGATNAIYSFILHDFCDVFLELTKYYIKKSCPETEYVQHVLYDVLEKSLRLLHPMMPYVTEELWHRLPGSEHFSTSSIMVAPYPQPENCRNVESENEMKILLDVSHSIRSLKSYYQLTNKVLPQIWALTKSEQIQNLVEKSKNIIVTLSFVESITVVRSKESVPPGCGLKVINTDLSVCILLKGIIDPGKEKDRLDKKLKLCQQQLDSLEKKMNISGYSDKVPQEIRKANDEKKNSLVTEISQIGEALDALRTLL